jgi:hypothetical protein
LVVLDEEPKERRSVIHQQSTAPEELSIGHDATPLLAHKAAAKE